MIKSTPYRILETMQQILDTRICLDDDDLMMDFEGARLADI
jgi:hypothetical protein